VFLGCLSEPQTDELPQARVDLDLSLVPGYSACMRMLYHRVRRRKNIGGKFGDTSMSLKGPTRHGRDDTIPAVVDMEC